jgi:hypothetical protein
VEALESIAAESHVQYDGFTMEDWDRLVEVFIKKGRLPIIAWFKEGEVDMFRFAHLTFQEFLCAELCKERVNADRLFITTWRDLVWMGNMRNILQRGWWQQVIQMYCDLARMQDTDDTAASTACSIDVGTAFLNLGRSDDDSGKSSDGDRVEDQSDIGTVEFSSTTDSSILTITSLLHHNTVVEKLVLSKQRGGYYNDGGHLTSIGVNPLVDVMYHNTSLVHVDLSNNSIEPAGGLNIARWLAASPQVKHLDLRWNHLCIGEMLDEYQDSSKIMEQYMHQLSYLIYKADVSGIDALIHAVDGHPSLQHFDLRGNGVGCDSARQLVAVLDKPGARMLDFVNGIPVKRMQVQIFRTEIDLIVLIFRTETVLTAF